MLEAAREGRLEDVQRLVRGGAVDVGTGDEANGQTALGVAAGNGHLEVVRWLVREGGSSVEERDRGGWTALLFAAANGRLEMVRWLVREGGSSVEENNDGNTALILAAMNGHLEVVRWLVQEGGSSVDENNNNGNTALLLAAMNGELEMVRWLLLEGGSSIDERNNDGDSLWELVSKWNNDDGKEDDEDDDDEEDEDPVDEEAATACLRTCLTLGAPPDSFDVAARLSPEQHELACKAVVLRARLPEWLERRRSLVREVLSRFLPSALGGMVEGYFEPSEEEMWDEDVGVPLGEEWGELFDLRMECSRLRKEMEERDVEVARLQEENARLRDQNARLQEEVARQQEGQGGLS